MAEAVQPLTGAAKHFLSVRYKDMTNDDEDDTEALMAELEQIRKERAEEKLCKEREEQEEELKVKEAELIQGNPLLNNGLTFGTTRRWDDDVVFNDTIRSDFHRKFLHKYIK